MAGLSLDAVSRRSELLVVRQALCCHDISSVCLLINLIFILHVSAPPYLASVPPPLNSLTFRPVVGQLSEVVPFLLLERCYVGLVAVHVQEQAEGILVPPLLQNCLTLNYIFP